MRDTIRRRDTDLQGFLNPMVSDHGETSEARQYAGRAVPEDWSPPFEPDPAAVDPSSVAAQSDPDAVDVTSATGPR
jgi:FPC/CPF motif-containing protein YcgG